jgi:transcriptional repressor NrdR
MKFAAAANATSAANASPPMSMWPPACDGRREPFDHQKLLAGIQVASVKRPISSDAIAQVVSQIEEALNALGRAEVPSSVIGNLVLDHLAQLDQVAYIRFASVYLEMNDLNEIRAEIDRLMGR